MPKATRREINQSTADVPEQRINGKRRCGNQRTWGTYTSESPKQRVPMLNRKKADPRDLLWLALGKQVRAGSRVTVRL